MGQEKKLEPKNIENIFALTSLQEGMLFHFLKEPESDQYFEQLCLEVSGEIDFILFKKTWALVVDSNQMLRTVFRWEKLEKPVQIELKRHVPTIRFHNFSGIINIPKSKLLEDIKAADRNEKFHLKEVPFRITLCKLEEKKHMIILSNHHILYDGWSNGIIIKEFFNVYNDFVSSRTPVKPNKNDFKEFINWIQNQDINEQRIFWADYLDGFVGETKLQIEKKRETGIPKGGSFSLKFTRNLTSELNKFFGNNRVSLASLFYGAWGILLQKYNDCNDVVFGTTVSGRDAKIEGIENIVGLFINTIPLRVQTQSGETIKNLLDGIDQTLISRKIFESTPLVHIQTFRQSLNGEALFNSVIDIENYPLDYASMRSHISLFLDSHSIIEMTNYDLTLVISIRDHIEVTFLYNTELFEEESIVRLSGHFMHLVHGMIKTPEKDLIEMEIITEEEKQQILLDFNDTDTEFPRDKTVNEWFEDMVAKKTDNSAIEYEGRQLTYIELNKKANQIAELLRNKSIKSDDIIGLMVERSIEMMVGILGILKSGGAYLPVEPDYPQERVRFMLDDSNAKLLLTQRCFKYNIDNRYTIIDLDDTNNTMNSPTTLNPEKINEAKDLAYVIYTSGSTGKPKGVMIEHGAIVNLLYDLKAYYPATATDVYLLKTSYTFDVSVAELFGWFPGGGKLVMLERGGEKSPEKMLYTIDSKGITHINFVPSMFNVFIEMLSDNDIKKLSNLKYIFIAGEALLPGIVKKFRCLNINISLENLYGPTEATVYASRYSLSDWSGNDDIPIGKPISNINHFIVDKDNHLRPVGIPGELCIAGVSLARGYLNHTELTHLKFESNSFKEGDRMYKTGDIGRWLTDGNIEFLGRVDHQIKIRGFRIELGEIESRLLKHGFIKEAVVLDRTVEKGNKYLCAYFILNSSSSSSSFQISDLRDYLSKELPDYMIPSYFVQLERFPLSISGKIDKIALPIPENKNARHYTAPRNEMEEKLANIWSHVLDINKDEIGIDDNFFAFGGHSLKATRMIALIHKHIDIKISLGQFFKTPTIRGLSKYLEESEISLFSPIETVEKKEYYQLSSGQKRIFILHSLDYESLAYNMPFILILTGIVDREKLIDSFRKLIYRHEGLRTSFIILDGWPVQMIHEDNDFALEYYDLNTEIHQSKNRNKKQLIQEFVRHFDLASLPLFRVGMIKVSNNEHILMVDMHHIIADGVSMEIFVKELFTLHTGNVLPHLKLHYKDYSEWINNNDNVKRLNKQGMYWLEQFTGEIPVLDLPGDFPRPVIQSFEGRTIGFRIEREQRWALKKFALDNGATLYMVLLAVYNILLSKLSTQEDIVIGTPVAGRFNADLEQIFGFFVNTLCLRNYPSSEKTFTDFFQEVKENTLLAFENQNYPYEDLVERLSVDRDLSRNPLFDTMFVLQDSDVFELEIPGVKVKAVQYDYENDTTKFDLTLQVSEEKEGILFTFQYCTGLFKQTTIERFCEYFKNTISHIIVNPGVTISEIEMISEYEKHLLLFEFNDTAAEYPKEKAINELFEIQAEKTPDNIAIVGPCVEEIHGLFQHITYRELNKKTNRLLSFLRQNGVSPDSIVGIMVERSIELIIGILGILKAGGAYLPIDSYYPQERIGYILKDSNAKILLAHDLIIEATRFTQRSQIAQLTQPHQLAYVIYTSGSTGNPKGVLVEHCSVVNLVYYQKTRFDISEDDRVLLFFSISFDASVEQIFITFLSGAILVLLGREILLDSQKMEDSILIHQITHLHATPSYLTILSIERVSRLKRIISGGEVCPVSVAKKWSKNFDFFNEYGPTETTVTSVELKASQRDFETVSSTLSIGSPIANTTVYLLDRRKKIIPIGVVGELYIGGDGIARGYLNNPELTGEKFVRLTLTTIANTFYKTGDRARWLDDGNMEFLGRLDQQVKIRGFRIELGEIEKLLITHEAIKESVVLVRESESGENYLCAYVVSDKVLKIEQLRKYMAENLPDYMIPSYFIFIDKVPLTPNGKVDRRALPGPEILESGAEYIAPKNEIEIKLTEIWGDVLNIPKEKIGINVNFFDIGGYSLKATTLLSKIHKEFNVKVQLAAFFQTPTIRSLAEYIKAAVTVRYFSIEVTEKKEYYTLSPAQKRLFFLHQLDSNNTAYNIPLIMRVEGEIDKQRCEETIRQLISRHDSLRTSFQEVDNKPVQRINEDVTFEVEYYTSEAIIHRFIRPFNLSNAPLLRVGLIKEKELKVIFMIDMYHIIADGVSTGIFFSEFMSLYSGESLAPLTLQYKDYSEWLNHEERRSVINEQGKYWQKDFEGEIPVLNLPTDYPRPFVKSFEGDSMIFDLDVDETEKLKAIACREEATLYMILLTLYNILLSKLSGQEDIIVGTTIRGRNHADLEHIIGMFVNTLAIRNYPESEKTFKEFLREVKQKTLASFENQDYPFEELVGKSALKRDLSRNPLFDVMFDLQNFGVTGAEWQGKDLKLIPYEYHNREVKFDMVFVGVEKEDGLSLVLEFSTKLFKRETIEKFKDYFREIISQVGDNDIIKLENIRLSHHLESVRPICHSEIEFDF